MAPIYLNLALYRPPYVANISQTINLDSLPLLFLLHIFTWTHVETNAQSAMSPAMLRTCIEKA